MDEKGFYCPRCRKYVSSHTVHKTDVLTVKELTIEIVGQIRVCDECGSELFDRELEKEIETAAFEAYRKRKDMLKPDEIKRIRMQYGLSQVSFARLLGFGDKTIARYENGSLQDDAPNPLIYLMNNPANMLDMLQRFGRDRLCDEEFRNAMRLARGLIYFKLSVYKTLFVDTTGNQEQYSIRQSSQTGNNVKWRSAG